MSTAPKRWTVKVVSPATGALQVLRNDVPLLNLPVGSAGVTPVELMLVSAATCLALSCHAAFPVKQLERVAFEVIASGRKAAQLPSRLDELRLRIDFGGRLAPQTAHELAALAKQMCTVTNTLTAVPPCVVELEVA